MSFTLKAPAKINWHLAVGPRRPGGYHNLQTLFQEISLCDELRFTAAPAALSMEVVPPVVATDHSNLVLRALALLRQRLRVKKGAHVTLFKRIPLGAGLGGGSSDAAAALWGGWYLWKKGGRPTRAPQRVPAILKECAKKLGADVSFFLEGGSAWGEGIGEKLRPVPAPPRLWVVLVYPRVHVNTGLAYGMLDAARKGSGRRPGMLLAGTLNDQVSTFVSGRGQKHAGTTALRTEYLANQRLLMWRESLRRKGISVPYPMFNDFEPVVFKKFPNVKAAHAALTKKGLNPVRMSGSGSTVFGVARSRAQANAVALKLRRRGWDVFVVKTA